MSYKKSVRSRRRYLSYQTDYYHRFKMLTNYDKVIRLTFNKKNAYMTSGLYVTKDLSKSDVCIKCWDSRSMLKNLNVNEVKKYHHQVVKEFVFGELVGEEISKLMTTEQLKNLKLVLDVGPRKHKRFSIFVNGFRTKCSLLNNSVQIPTEYSETIKTFVKNETP